MRLVVLAGDGDKAFISGADISQFEKPRGSEEAQAIYNRVVEAAYHAPMPRSEAGGGARSAASAWAAGSGSRRPATCASRRRTRCSACRRRASASATASPACAASCRCSARPTPRDIFFSARKFDAKDALRMGFVSRVVPAAELDREVGGVLRADGGERAAHAGRGEVRDPQKGLKDAGARDLEALQRKVDACFSERGLQGRPQGVHGEAQAQLQGPLAIAARRDFTRRDSARPRTGGSPARRRSTRPCPRPARAR